MGRLEDLAAQYGVSGDSQPAPAAAAAPSRLSELAQQYGVESAAPKTFQNTGPVGDVLADLKARREAIPSFAQELAQSVVNPVKHILSASDFAGRAMLRPTETFGQGRAPAVGREVMRGVNSNIPGANWAVEQLGGQPAYSAEDATAAPGAQAFGSVAGTPVAGMVGGIAAKGAEAAAPALGRAVSAIGEGAQERRVTRALENMEEKVNKGTRGRLKADAVTDAVREDPALLAAAGNDAKLAEAKDALRKRASSELKEIYGDTKVTLGQSIDNFNQRINALRETGTSTDAAVADQLEKMRDEFTSRLGQRGVKNPVSLEHLRAEQSDYQTRGWGKAMPGDEPATVRIAAAREASKAVGDAVVKEVTGMDYEAAKAAAEADPNGTAARLFKANDQVTASNRIEAAIKDRANRVQPKEGLAGKLWEAGKEIKHSPLGFAASQVPFMASRALNLADNVLARTAGMGDALASAPAAIGRVMGGASPQAVGQMVQLAHAGLRGSELTAMAQQYGIPPERAQAFADLVAQTDARKAAP